MTITFRLAEGPGDIATVATLWTEAAAWLADQDTDQWQYPIKTHNIEAAVADSSCWIVEDNGEPVGTITVDTDADPGLWTAVEVADAVIVHRMVVARRHAGRGLGEVLLRHAERLGRERGRRWLRLDAWTTNTRLHAYYQRVGFRLVRVADQTRLPAGVAVSAALFERPIP